MNGVASSDDILCEIERLEAEKKEIENRIHLLRARLNDMIAPDISRKEDDTDSCPRPPANSFRNGEVSGEGLSADMIYRYSRHLLLPDFGVEGFDRFFPLLLTRPLCYAFECNVLVLGNNLLGSKIFSL